MNRLKTLALIITLIVLVISGCVRTDQSPTSSSQQKSQQALADQVAEGQNKYEKLCQICHGAKVKMGMMAGMGNNVKVFDDIAANGMIKSLAGSQEILAEFVRGNTPMTDDAARVAITLSQADSQAVAAYLWSGQGKVVNIEPIALTSNDVGRGSQLFKQYCDDCHGIKGNKMRIAQPERNRLVKNLSSDPSRLAGFLQIYGPMTDDGKKDPKITLSQADSQALAAYIWSIKEVK